MKHAAHEAFLDAWLKAIAALTVARYWARYQFRAVLPMMIGAYKMEYATSWNALGRFGKDRPGAT